MVEHQQKKITGAVNLKHSFGLAVFFCLLFYWYAAMSGSKAGTEGTLIN